MKLFLALMLCAAPAFAQLPFAFKAFTDSDTTPAALTAGIARSTCVPGATATITQQQPLLRGAIGGYLYVQGYPDIRYNGIYRIVGITKTLAKNGEYDWVYIAECIKK